MWLRLYQSASIWLVFGLSRAPTHRSTVPQVQIGLRPIASRIAAAAATIRNAKSAARRADMRATLSRAKRVAKHRRSLETRAPMLRAYGPGCDGSIVEAKAETHSRRRDVDRPRKADRGGGTAGRALHRRQRSDPRGNGGDRAVEPPLRAQWRALHDHQRAVRGRRRQPRRRPRSASSSPAIGWLLCATRLPSRCWPSSIMSGASRSWRGMRRRCCRGCSTPSSTAWPTSSRGSAARSSRSPRISSRANWRRGESPPRG